HRPHPSSALCPYPTLFRSHRDLTPAPSGRSVPTLYPPGGGPPPPWRTPPPAKTRYPLSYRLRMSLWFPHRRPHSTPPMRASPVRSEEHTCELQSRGHLVCR